MISITLHDVLWRWRRFLVALLATALVLALTLVLDGVNRSFGNEASRTVAALGADQWFVPPGSTSVFLSSAVMPEATLEAVSATPGVTAAAALAVVRADLQLEPTDAPQNLNLIGLGGTLPPPDLDGGRWPTAAGEATLERSAGVELGEEILVAEQPFTVVGLTDGLTYTAGVPIAFVGLADAQQVGYGGAPLVTAIAATGDGAPDGLAALTDDDVRANLLIPLANASQTIQLILNLLWAVAVMVIGSVVYLTSLDRTRDFAVLKATGATNGSLLGGLAFQAGLLSGGAALLSVFLAQLLVPLVPVKTELEPASYLVLFAVAIGVALLSSLVSVRRTLAIDPALAFAGA